MGKSSVHAPVSASVVRLPGMSVLCVCLSCVCVCLVCVCLVLCFFVCLVCVYLVCFCLSLSLSLSLPLKLGGLGVGSAIQRHAAAPCRAWHSVISTSIAAHPFSASRIYVLVAQGSRPKAQAQGREGLSRIVSSLCP